MPLPSSASSTSSAASGIFVPAIMHSPLIAPPSTGRRTRRMRRARACTLESARLPTWPEDVGHSHFVEKVVVVGRDDASAHDRDVRCLHVPAEGQTAASGASSSGSRGCTHCGHRIERSAGLVRRWPPRWYCRRRYSYRYGRHYSLSGGIRTETAFIIPLVALLVPKLPSLFT